MTHGEGTIPPVTKKRVFITGGASGLGKALAERYGAAGWDVCVGDLDVARSADVLAALRAGGGGGRAHALACDVTKDADVQAAADWLAREWGGVDLVINNAGVAQIGGIADVPMDDWRWIVDINLLGVVRGCRVFTPLLRAQGGGHIVNVASVAGLLYTPKASAYSATKAAVVALSETLALELAPDKITVSVVCPAFFRTSLHENMRAHDADSARQVRKLVGESRISAEAIAEKVFQGVARGKLYILTHPDYHMAWWVKRFLPVPLYQRLVAHGIRTAEEKRARRAAARAAKEPT
jgi:NAD(P)-dependent dehydrogenase (short-subunit alcohol dehydrogenase family)